jgi:hypothetical protein
MNSELERIWKEGVVAGPSNCAGICLEGMRKPMEHLSQDRECPDTNSNRALPLSTFFVRSCRVEDNIKMYVDWIHLALYTDQ